MSSEATCPITLTVAGDPRLARLVRMTAANVGALCSMSVDRIEDIRMAARRPSFLAARLLIPTISRSNSMSTNRTWA